MNAKTPSKQDVAAKPFLKWAGGKKNLISDIEARFPAFVKNKERFTYIEPFLGGGAMMFHVLGNYADQLNNVIVCDINKDLVRAYETVKDRESTDELISKLREIEIEYSSTSTTELRSTEGLSAKFKKRFKEITQQKYFYYKKRLEYNEKPTNDILNTALLIFLNRTCFNGLYRVSENGFNVPIGSNANPTICNEALLRRNSEILNAVTFLSGDYQKTLAHIDDQNNNNLFYFDPPYKPISKTSHFNKYAIDEFNDEQQIRLKEYCDSITAKGAHFILSNSDPKDKFFHELYRDYNINEVQARRSINSKATKRGPVTELLITNFQTGG